MKCVERKIVTFSFRESSISSSQKPSRATGSTPEVGSSRIRTSGSWMHRHGERQALSDAERNVLRQRVRNRLEFEFRHELGDARFTLLGRHIEEPSVQH